MTDNTSSDGASATPAPGSLATSTTTSGGATPPKSPTTLEEALAELADIRRHATNKEEQATRHGKELTSAQKRLAEYEEKERLAQEAALTEQQKLAKRAEDAEARYQQTQKQLISAHVKMAAHTKGIIDPDIAALAVQDKLEYGEDGLPSNLDKALDDLIKNKPYLVPVKIAEEPTTPAQTAQPQQQRAPQVPPMNPGRSSITPPDSNAPFKPVRLTDVYKRPF
jgi:chromosome segregation ATPase